MLRRRLILGLALAAVSFAGTSTAEEKKKPGKEELQAVDLSPVGIPVVWQGKLVNYVFATVRLPVGRADALAKARSQEPYFRDILVRLAHRRPFTDPHDLTRIDEAALRRALLPEAQRIAGPGVITGVVVVSQQPQRRVGLPDVRAAAPADRAPIP